MLLLLCGYKVSEWDMITVGLDVCCFPVWARATAARDFGMRRVRAS